MSGTCHEHVDKNKREKRGEMMISVEEKQSL